MSVPLDQLYNFLEDVIDSDNLVIYRFYPHGSKNIKDLGPLREYEQYPNEKVCETFLTKYEMICHDQEPLDFDMYRNETGREFNWQQTFPDALEYVRKSKQGLASVTLTNGKNLHDNYLLLNSEKNSKDLEQYEKSGYIGVYYWSHAIIALDWYRYAKLDKKLLPKQTWPEKDFVIYNRAWSNTREYRLKLSQLLVENDLVKNCNTRFSSMDSGTHYHDYKFKNENFKPNIVLENYFETNSTKSTASADYVSDDYNKAAIEVVLETLYDDSRLHLTEKILRPIACGQPWILAATAGSLSYLRSYGFKTFSPYINEEYDTIQDPILRLQAIVNELKRISDLPIDQKNAILVELQKIADYNKQRFFSQEFFGFVMDEFKQNFFVALDKLEPLRKGTKWLSFQRKMYDEYLDAYRYMYKIELYTREQTVKLHQWIKNPPKIHRL